MTWVSNQIMKGLDRAIGYARVSTDDQNLDLQLNALELAGCTQLFQDHGVSAVSKKRPGFDQALDFLQTGDVFVVWKMDRAFRSLHQALDVLDIFQQRDIQFRSLTDCIDTTNAMGLCMYHITNAFSQLERSLISERTIAGMAVARDRGVHIGRPRMLSSEEIKQAHNRLQCEPGLTQSQAARELGVSPRTFSRAIALHCAEI